MRPVSLQRSPRSLRDQVGMRVQEFDVTCLPYLCSGVSQEHPNGRLSSKQQGSEEVDRGDGQGLSGKCISPASKELQPLRERTLSETRRQKCPDLGPLLTLSH